MNEHENEDINAEENIPEKDTEKTEKNHFHWKDMVQVWKRPNASRRMGLVAGGAILFLMMLFFFVLPSSHPVSTNNNSNADHVSEEDLVVKQNERRLALLRAQGLQSDGQRDEKSELNNDDPLDHSGEKSDEKNDFSFTTFGNSTELDRENTKQMLARQNAPTQMYLAPTNVNTVGGENTGAPANSSSATLVGQGGFSDFANNQSGSASVVTGSRMAHPNDTVAEGEFISATLETAIDSDVPGMVRAVTTEPIYAYTGETPLIPAGSRLIGQYTSLSSNGAASERIFVMWNRILTPQGISIMVNSPGADQLGEGGMGADAIDVHFWKMFGTAALLSVMGATTANAGVSANQQPNSADAYRQSIASAMQQSAQNALNQNLNIQPTLHIHQGDPVTVFVAHDLDLHSVLQ